MSGLDIDTRSDIYSLGVLLYELLTGRPPFDPKSLVQAGLDEIRRVIRDTEPPRPSKNLSTLGNADLATVARQRGTEPAKLSVLLQGDLDWIVMRCLEKCRTRRYDTAAGLARDIRRHLENEPVEARPPSTAYVLQKLVRRHKWVFISGGAIAVVLISGVIASTLEAVRAERAERIAGVERGRAENLLTFMLGDLHTQLARVGRLDVLESATDKAMAYFASSEPAGLTDTELARQSKALNQIGEIRIAQANYTAAAAAFSEAYERTSTLAARHPGDGDLLFDRGQAEYWNGFVLWKRGELAKAADWMKRYYDTCVGLVLLDPARPAWQSELAYGLHNLGAVYDEKGDMESARSDFKEELAALEKLLKADPANADLLRRQADVHSWLGEIAESQGDLPEASAQYAAQAQQYERLADADPGTAGKRYDEANALYYEAKIGIVRGQFGPAGELVDKANAILAQLTALDPENVHWRASSLDLLLTKALLSLHGGGRAQARSIMNDVVPGLESVSAAAPADRRYAALLCAAWRLKAEIDSLDGRPGAAEAAKNASAVGERLIHEGRAIDADIGECADSYVVAGEIAEKDGKTDEARRDWLRAAELLAPRIQGSRNWQLLDPAARAASHLGRSDEARAMIAELTLLGYTPVDPWPDFEPPSAKK
jgi:tetratricopeptide (TPR) repeat protein